MEVSAEYMNKFAEQMILISSLLAGFSMTIVANLLTYEGKDRLTINILKSATVAAGAFLVTVFTMTGLLLVTSRDFPVELRPYTAMDTSRIIGATGFFLGLAALSVVIALAGWTKSRSTGIFTTTVGIITFLIMMYCLT